MSKNSLHMRIMLWGWVILICALLLTLWFYYGTVASELTSSQEQSTERLLEYVKWRINQSSSAKNSIEFQNEVNRLGSRLGIRITYIIKGKVVADSKVSAERLKTLDDHSHRPEVIEAVKDGKGENIRHSATLDTKMLYVAAQMPGEGNILRLAMPYSKIKQSLSRVKTSFFIIFIFIAIGSFLITFILGRRTTRAVESLSETATAIGNGDYDKRIRVIPGGEFYPLAQSINNMAHRIKKHIKIIEDQKGQLNAIFENMHEGVMVLNYKGQIESVNRSLAQMFPSARNSEGRVPLEVLMRHEIQDAVDGILNNQDDEKQNLIIELSDGRSISISVVTFTDHKSRHKILLVFHDISEVRRVEKVLRDFVSNASHQLRTPLTSIKGYSETLIDNPPKEEEILKNFLGIIRNNADHMSKVITGMFALARSEYSGKKLKKEPTSLVSTLNQSVGDVANQAAEKGISISVSNIPDVDVLGTHEGLVQIFDNLMENAVKYAPEDSDISIEVANNDEDIIVKVIDKGPGIPHSEQNRIFEKFFKLDENAIEKGSSGLGLAICRSLVRNFDGDIWVESPVDATKKEGSAFCVTLKKVD